MSLLEHARDLLGAAATAQKAQLRVEDLSLGAWVEVDEEKLLVCRVGELLGVLEEIREEAGDRA